MLPDSPQMSSQLADLTSQLSDMSPSSPRISLQPMPDLATKLPPGFARTQGVSFARPRTPDYLPTSHIGSNVFAKKTPYGATSGMYQYLFLFLQLVFYVLGGL